MKLDHTFELFWASGSSVQSYVKEFCGQLLLIAGSKIEGAAPSYNNFALI